MPRRNAIPLYLQISSMLIRDIQARHYHEGDRLPPERELAKQLGVTVTTLRKSLNDIESKGFLERRHGSGNYVRSGGKDDSIYSFFRLELKTGGGLPKAQLLSVDKLPKPDGFPDFGESLQAFRFRRIRSLNDIPVAAEEIWLDASYANEIQPQEVLQSLYLYYRTAFGLWITEVEDYVGLDQFPDWVNLDEELSAGKPCPFVERVSWAQNGQKAEYSRNWFSSKRAHYVARLK